MKRILNLIISLAITLTVGGISGYITAESIPNWYATLNKPSFNPPNSVFGPVWTVLYILMGISLYLIWNMPHSSRRARALIVFGVQLILNFFWSIIFFDLEAPGWALIEILVLWSFILAMIITFHKMDKVAGLLQIPYLCWVTFAAVLNASIWVLN